MQLDFIKDLCEKRTGGLKQLAGEIGMSEQNLHRCIRNNKIQASDLEKIAQLLGVDIKIFFCGNEGSVDASGNGNAISSEQSTFLGNNSVSINTGDAAVLAERVRSLEALLAEKERLIKVYEAMAQK